MACFINSSFLVSFSVSSLPASFTLYLPCNLLLTHLLPFFLPPSYFDLLALSPFLLARTFSCSIRENNQFFNVDDYRNEIEYKTNPNWIYRPYYRHELRILFVSRKTTVIQHRKNVTFILFKTVYQLITPITPTERKASFIAENKLLLPIAHDVFFISPYCISGGITHKTTVVLFSPVQVFYGKSSTTRALH